MDRLQRVGAALVVVGVVATLVTMWPLVSGRDPYPLGWYLAAMLAPIGLALILWSFWRQARARGRRTRAQRGRPSKGQ